MQAMLRRYGYGLSGLTVLLTAFWLLMLVILPYLNLFKESFRPYLIAKDIGGSKDVFTFDNYLSILHEPTWTPHEIFGFQFFTPMTIHLQVFLATIAFSCFATFVAIVACYPMAFYMAKVLPPKRLSTYLMILIIPLWVSELMRAFAWFILLTYKGPLTVILMDIGVLSDGVRWTWYLWGYSGVVVTLVYVYVLFMLFPIYNSMTSLDMNQVEAARDLGSPSWRTHWRVVLPHCKPGIASGSVMVFMLSAGSLLVPGYLDSPSSQWFTEVIYARMFDQNDWNGGAAYAFLMVFACMIFVTIAMRVFRVGLSDIAK
ncbi:MAG TPA: ABC transporter permease [Aestuariivirga sp.]